MKYYAPLSLALFTALSLGACEESEDATTDSTSASTTTDDDESSESVEALSYKIVDSSQASCYDTDGEEIDCPSEGEEYYGQDAQFDGYQPSYTDNDDGTVTDNVTGLMWQQSPSADNISYTEAEAVCEALELATYTDWRMPSTKELFSISDFSQGWPYLNQDYFDLAEEGQVSKDEQYWTEPYVGQTVEGQDNAAFGVNHGTGHIKAYAAAVSGPMGNHVRCVRGDTYGINSFVANGDGTVTDEATGLMWQAADSGAGMDWPSALEYAQNSELGGYTDWRLPNVKELQSIVDYRYSPSASDEAKVGPAIDSDYFTLTPIDETITNTDNDYGYYWTSTSAYFGGNQPEYYYAWYVAFGTAVDGNGDDSHGAGAARFDTKIEGGPLGEGDARYYNYVLIVRDADLSHVALGVRRFPIRRARVSCRRVLGTPPVCAPPRAQR